MRYPRLVRYVPAICLVLQGIHFSGKAQPSEFYFEPGGFGSNLPQRTLSIGYRRGWRVTFGTPGILQVTEDPASGVWHGLSVDGSYTFDPEDPAAPPWQFYRVLSAERPTKVYVPDSYDPAVAAPLIVSLHGHGSYGAEQGQYMNILPLAESRGFLYCTPDGTVAQDGYQFWNASASCCDVFGTGVDDSTYLRELVETVSTSLNVDAKRIYFMGLSNGAFMSYRMALDHSDLVAAVACLAGTVSAEDPFEPSEPVNVLHIHGTADSVISYDGGVLSGLSPHLGAEEVIELWAEANGCLDRVAEAEPSADLISELDGLDTSVTRYDQSPLGGDVELWTIHGGSHTPDWPPSLSKVCLERIVDWLLAHPKP
jgi:polyhydroxybutyrate depolymerase